MPDPTAVTATELRRSVRAVMRRVDNGERVVVERHGQAALVLVSPADAALLAAIDAVIVARGLQPAEPEDWSSVFPDLKTFGDVLAD